jgi:hypothetical protein
VRTFRIVATSFAVVLIATGASAQGEHPYPLHEMNFDMWCQEQQHLPPERCDKRLPQDDAEFQAYANKIEGYETQQLNQQRQENRIDQAINRADPSANAAGTPPTQPIPPPRP